MSEAKHDAEPRAQRGRRAIEARRARRLGRGDGVRRVQQLERAVVDVAEALEGLKQRSLELAAE